VQRSRWQFRVSPAAIVLMLFCLSLPSPDFSGLALQTIDSIARISVTSAAAAEAGANVGDALFEIGNANVLGLSAGEVVQLLVGCAGADGAARSRAALSNRGDSCPQRT
jgi:hypothetical protein